MSLIILRGQPKSTQHCYKATCRGKFASIYMSADCKAIKEDYQYQAKLQWKDEILTGDIRLTIRLYFGTKRKVDWDNFHKLSMDALEGIVFENDSQIVEVLVSKHYDKENPRIEIDVYNSDSIN